MHLMVSFHLDTCALRVAQVCEKKSSHTFMVAEPLLQRTRSWRCHVCGASHPRTTGTTAASICRPPSYASRIGHSPQYGGYEVARPVGEPKTLMPDRFGKKNCPSWRTWSYLARDFVGVVHATLKQAMKAAESQKQPVAVTHLQHEFNVTNEMDQELQHFLISRTEGEAVEVVREAEREPGLAQLRRLAPLYDPQVAGRSLDDSRQILSPPKAAQIDDLSHTIQPGKILNNATENAHETSCLKTCDWLFFSPCASQTLKKS